MLRIALPMRTIRSLSENMRTTRRTSNHSTVLKKGKSPVYEMLQRANDYLYQSKGKQSDFLKLADANKNYIEMLNNNAGTAGLTALYLCYSVATDAVFDENYNGIDDDNAFDYEDLLPDFYASMAYSGGNPFINTGDIEKRREFWNWYIDMVEAIINDPQKPVLPLIQIQHVAEQTEHFVRNQNPNTPTIEDNIKDAIKQAVALLDKKKIVCDSFIVDEICMRSGRFYKIATIKNGKQSDVKIEPIEHVTYKISYLLNKVKDEMYQQYPKEGAWLTCQLLVNNNQCYEIDFNYDNKNKLPSSKMDFLNMEHEFKYYPRSKDFMPKWWQEILGKKAKYLK